MPGVLDLDPIVEKGDTYRCAALGVIAVYQGVDDRLAENSKGNAPDILAAYLGEVGAAHPFLLQLGKQCCRIMLRSQSAKSPQLHRPFFLSSFNLVLIPDLVMFSYGLGDPEITLTINRSLVTIATVSYITISS